MVLNSPCRQRRQLGVKCIGCNPATRPTDRRQHTDRRTGERNVLSTAEFLPKTNRANELLQLANHDGEYLLLTTCHPLSKGGGGGEIQ